MKDAFSALQRAEIAEIWLKPPRETRLTALSVLFNEPKLLKSDREGCRISLLLLSVLFNEPKLLKSCCIIAAACAAPPFSALQRAEIAEIIRRCPSSP